MRSCISRSLAGFTLALGLVAPGAAAAENFRIVAIGDSDTGGTSGAMSSYPALLQKRLREQGLDVTIHNEGTPGLIASQAFGKLDALPAGTNLVILHFGTSDIKHNIQPQALQADLEKMIAIVRQRGAKVLVVAGRPPAPRQVPSGYNIFAYNSMYSALRSAAGVTIYRFNSVLPPPQGDLTNTYQPDTHLTASGNALVANDMAITVERLLKNPGS